MKRVLGLTIVVLLAITICAAAAPPGKRVSLEITNQSGETVYMALSGKYYDQYYYLVIKNGKTVTYTLVPDFYYRTTWACGIKNKGALVMASKTRLTFTRCFVKNTNYGEPGNEKVSYFPWIDFSHGRCGWYTIIEHTWKSPVGCFFRYQY